MYNAASTSTKRKLKIAQLTAEIERTNSKYRRLWNLAEIAHLYDLNANYWKGNISWLKSGELTDSLIILSSEEKITEEGLKNSSAKLFPKGTILIALYGATAGKLGILTFESTTNQAVCGFFENDFIETKYLFYYLRSFRKKMIEDSWGQAQPNISQTYLKDFLFALPPKKEQKCIVVEIDRQLAKTKQLKEHVIANQLATEQLLKALLHQAFEVTE